MDLDENSQQRPSPAAGERPHKFSDFFYNGVTYCGAALALLVFIAECFLFGMDFFTRHDNIYLGIVTYVALPPFLILGLILIPWGALRQRRRVLKGTVSARPKSFYINPSIPTHRNAILVFVVGTTILLIMTAIGSYQAFHYTESVHFCGQMCHQVMHPQYTAYIQSPHARVKCVDCHIGAGADWYVRSKLSGLRQVYRTITDSYEKPIPTPVHDLRPAAETCEQCHWPGKFYSSFELRRTYYPQEDSDYSKWLMRMLVRVGGDSETEHGIHAHMYLDNEVYYVADDERRQEISWVKSVGKDGQTTIYTAPGSEFADKEPPSERIRKMDCMDCHNRPTHHFRAPSYLINQAFLRNKIDPGIPSFKEKAVEALAGEYASDKDAETAIRKTLTDYYTEDHSEYYAQNKQQVDQAIEELVVIFKNNIFPEMKARWDVYPDNIGHFTSPGCFRCHDGEHVSPVGKPITRDCNVCHTIIEQGPPGELQKNTEGLIFEHPFGVDQEMWQELNCYDCHSQ